MNQADRDIGIFFRQMSRKMLCTIDRPMLSSCASERDHKVRKSTPHKRLHMRIHNPIDMFQETKYLTVIFQESYHRFIPSCQLLIWFISSGVMNGTAIKDITSSRKYQPVSPSYMKSYIP